MFWKNKNKKNRSESANEADLRASGPVLRITVGEKQIASLFHDGESYCLLYTAEFASSGLAPFNSNDFSKGKLPEVNHVYRSNDLWQVFASRIPSAERGDFKVLLSSLGLTGSENPLIILGKVGKVSISKPWKLVLVENKKVS
ncbi:MAG: hypothetical protein AB7F66_13525 [Bacteriovoracia bacterium]